MDLYQFWLTWLVILWVILKSSTLNLQLTKHPIHEGERLKKRHWIRKYKGLRDSRIKLSNSYTTGPSCIILFVCFCCFESRSGYKDRQIGRFSPSPSVVWRSVLWPGDWRILLLCTYIPAPFTESFDRLGRRMIFKVAGAGIELELHNSSWPFSERLIHETIAPSHSVKHKN